MYRVLSILLAMVAIAVVFFGLSLCEVGTGVCEQARAATGSGLAAQPVQVQRILVVAGLLAFVGGVTGFLRGPTTLPPWANEARAARSRDTAHAPFLVRGAAFLGALIALAGMLTPALVFTAPAPGLGAPVIVTIVVSALLAAYFAWYLAKR
jgi:hypothetical protein